MSFSALLSRMVLALWQWLQSWWVIVNVGAKILILLLSPSSYRNGLWGLLARQIYFSTAPVLLWFTVLSSLLGLVLIRIVVVTAQSYGLSQYAVEMVVRVLVLELIPLGAALFVALRVSTAQAAQVRAMRESGDVDAMRAQGRDPLRWVVFPRAVAGMFAVLLLAAVSCVVALVIVYLSMHGFTPWALSSYTRSVGQVFSPVVTMIFAFKTCFFSLTVSLIPLVSSIVGLPPQRGVASSELQSLVRMFMALLVIEVVSLLGNYY